jgi:hypothetical protein
MQKPSWYLHRLRVMQRQEILHRSATVLGDLVSLLPIRRETLEHACRDPWQEDCQGNAVRFPCGPDQVGVLLEEIPDLRRRLESYARGLVQHKMSFFDLDGVALGRQIDWHRNYRDGVASPRQKASLLLDYRDPQRCGDIRYVWELNRLQHLVPLALASLLTGEKKFANEARDQILDWIAQNPFLRGINWTSALEVSFRLISWSWVFFFLKAGHAVLPSGFFRSLGEHCRFIHRHFSLYTSGGNHLVGEAAGLFIASTLFAREPERARWMHDARRILLEQIEEQVHDDGSHKELSLDYHAAVTELFLLAALFGRVNNAHFPAFYWDRLKAMCDYLVEIQDSGGWRPLLGDSDSGHCLLFEPPAGDEPDSLLTMAGILFDDPRYVRNVDRLDTKPLLPRGGEARTRSPPLKAQSRQCPGPSSKAFPDAGYIVLRMPWNSVGEVFLVFDAGNMGMEPMAGHGHADNLSFVLSVGGEPIFVDPGTYTYRTGDPWRDYFRGTSAHNTVRIDGRDFAQAGGPFLWIRKARSHMMICDPAGVTPRIRAEHDGYRCLDDPVNHIREIRIDRQNSQILILDEIEAHGQHAMDMFFHLDPQCDVACQENTWTITKENRRLLLIPDKQVEFRVLKGSTTPILGWYSPAYGRKVPTVTLVGSAPISGKATFVTRIQI